MRTAFVFVTVAMLVVVLLWRWTRPAPAARYTSSESKPAACEYKLHYGTECTQQQATERFYIPIGGPFSRCFAYTPCPKYGNTGFATRDQCELACGGRCEEPAPASVAPGTVCTDSNTCSRGGGCTARALRKPWKPYKRFYFDGKACVQREICEDVGGFQTLDGCQACARRRMGRRPR